MDESSRRLVQVDGDGAPKRRRLRRLRSRWRHEQQTVAAVLASAHHHSYDRKGMTKVVEHEGSEEVEYVPLDAPQGQITPPPGERPAPLAEVAAPQGLTLARCPVDGGPTLTVPVLVGRAAESVDSSALSFLLSQSLLVRRSWRQIWPPGSSSCWRRSRGSSARPLKPLQPGGSLPSRPRGRRRRRGGGRRNFLEVALDLGWFFLGNDFSAILFCTVVPLLREGGPRIPILRSIPPCAGGFWTNFTHFHIEDGLVPEVDSGYMLMRQSTVTFR